MATPRELIKDMDENIQLLVKDVEMIDSMIEVNALEAQKKRTLEFIEKLKKLKTAGMTHGN